MLFVYVILCYLRSTRKQKIDRNYLGEIEPYEKDLIEVMKNNMAAMEKVLLDYFDTEGELT